MSSTPIRRHAVAPGQPTRDTAVQGPAAGPVTDGATKRSHLFAIDLARLFAVALVVSVHTLSFAAASTNVPVGAFIMEFHSSREVFFLLTTLVLTYNYGRRQVRWMSFWRRRYWLLLPPYVAWSLIYFLADGSRLDPVSAAARAFAHDLLTAGARYHLYFLLVTMQIYLTYPLVRWLLKKTEGFHAKLFAVALVYELVVTWAVQHDPHGPGPIGFWLRNPNALLPSYVFYVVAGGLAGWHLDRLVAFTRRHGVGVAIAVGLGLACGLASYFAQIGLSHSTALAASAVFQPAVVVESVAMGMLFFVAGLSWERRGMPRRRLVSAGADASFGIFLAHPLVLQGVLLVGVDTGLLAAVHHLPVGFELVVLFCVMVPLIYGLSGVIAHLSRSTPVSLLVTGRPAPVNRSIATALRHRRAPADLPPESDLLTSPPADDPDGAVATPNAPAVVAGGERGL